MASRFFAFEAADVIITRSNWRFYTAETAEFAEIYPPYDWRVDFGFLCVLCVLCG